ncbi:DUF535 family protein [Frateuria sp. Soil773]|uniref:DUF535 family protein n=1 Tax=Frateuria sp. Soil773 TaxID=1736407 RepID=UPI001F2DBE9D|nr:DUF535 family protein [Frateuria sp. Soil773]
MRNRGDWGARGARRWAKAAKYAWRCLLRHRAQREWLECLYGSLPMRRIVAVQPRLHERWHHGYINRELRPGERLAIVRDHYATLIQRLPATTVKAIYVDGELRLDGRLSLKDGGHAVLALRRPANKGLEGELGLYLLDMQGRRLSSLIFTLGDQGRSLLIGCVQGAEPGMGLEAVREFTRQAYNLRPKNLLLSMAYALAGALDVERVRGVDNASHPFAGKPDKIKADYDGFWNECGGTAGRRGYYDLPPREAERDERDVESRHRSAFRRREALRRHACHMLLQTLKLETALAQAA